MTVQADTTADTDTAYLSYRYIDGWYDIVEDGYSDPQPIVRLLVRGEDMCQHIVSVAYEPYFYVEMNEALQKSEELANDHRVRRIETVEEDGSAISTPFNDEHGETTRLARIYTIKPYHVRQLRDNFENRWESDVRFVDRFCYDAGIVDTLAVPEHQQRQSNEPFSVDDIVTESVDCSVDPRIGYLDIEVQQSENGPSVVNERGKEMAVNPITAITIYDSYTRRYDAFILRHDDRHGVDYDVEDQFGGSVNISTYADEWALLADFASYCKRNRFDILTAWNASFDFPYLINRYFTLDHMGVYSLSPVGNVDDLDGEGQWMNGDVDGVILFDLLVGYEKSQIHELEDSRLETVARAETGIEKLSLDDELTERGHDIERVNDEIEYAREHEPSVFARYSIRDVEAMVAINESRGIL